ncbi:hypothetical protein KM043_005023 [Ampulex compressa]|nr:hypothetical protein KM043_005023 [Ampulex compressa]
MYTKAFALFLVVLACCVTDQNSAFAARPKACTDPIIPGRVTRFCDAISFRYAYDIKQNTCITIQYTGCRMGSDNSFRTQEECEKTCISSEHSNA